MKCQGALSQHTMPLFIYVCPLGQVICSSCLSLCVWRGGVAVSAPLWGWISLIVKKEAGLWDSYSGPGPCLPTLPLLLAAGQ